MRPLRHVERVEKMTQNYHKDSQAQKNSNEYEAKLNLVQAIVNKIDLMVGLLYEIKTGSPIGKTITILLNIYPMEKVFSNTEEAIPVNISLSSLARLAEISVTELKESLDYLQQEGIIYYSGRMAFLLLLLSGKLLWGNPIFRDFNSHF